MLLTMEVPASANSMPPQKNELTSSAKSMQQVERVGRVIDEEHFSIQRP